MKCQASLFKFSFGTCFGSGFPSLSSKRCRPRGLRTLPTKRMIYIIEAILY